MSLETFIKWFSGLMIFVLLASGIYFSFYIFFWSDVYEEIPVEPKKITVINADGIKEEIIYEKQDISKGKPFAALLLGVDTNDIKRGRSDSIVVAIVEPEFLKVTLLSIPRDSYVMNNYTGKLDKINHTYNHGISNTLATVEDFLNIPIDYYATVNMQGFIEAVDTIGGLEIEVEKDLSFHDRITNTIFSLQAGHQKLNGIQALNYARFRGDGEGDFGRNRRQRQVISELIKQTTKFENVTKITEFLGILEDNFRTNLSPLEIASIANQMNFGKNVTIETLELKASPARRGKMSVVVVDENQKQEIIQQLHQKLKLTQ